MKTNQLLTLRSRFARKTAFSVFLLFSLITSVAQPPPPGCPQVIDQDQATSNAATLGTDQWQSFTAGMTGDLTLVEFHTNGFSGGSQPFTYTIYAGVGTGGAVLYSNSSSYNTPSGSYFGMPIPPGTIPVTSGNQYTCRIQVSGSYHQMACNNGNPYGGSYYSSSYGTPAWDLKFRTWITNTTFPPASISPGGPLTFCQGGNVSLTANTGAFTYQWWNGASPIGGATGQNYTATTPGPHVVVVTNTLTNCWNNSPPTNVVVNPLPLATASNATVCETSTATLNITPSGGTPSYNFAWFNVATGGAPLVTTAAYTTPALAPSGIYTYYPEVTDANGCKTAPRPAVTVQVNPLPTIGFSGGPIVCNGGTANISASGASTYTWNPGGLIGTTQTLSAGTYTVAGNLAGCINTNTITVSQPPALSVSPSGPTTVCSGVPLNITLIGAGGTGPYTYSWIAGDNPSTTGESTTTISTGLINNIINSASTINQIVTYTLTVTDANSCSATQTVNVTINPKPVMSSGTSATICSGLTLNHTLSATVSGTFSWLATDNGNITGESTSAVVGPAINNTLTSSVQIAQAVSYTVTPTSSLGCAGNSQIITVTINPSPIITSANAIGICSGSAQSYNIVSNPAGGTYTWIAADNPNTSGESLTLQTTSTINNTLTSISAAAENVSYTITPTSSLGCGGAPFVFITSVNPKPTMTNPNTATICSGSATAIPLTSDFSSTYNWIASDNPNTTGESLSNQTAGIINNNITSSTLVPENILYTVTPTAITGGCVGPSQTVTVTVNPVPVLTSSFGTSVCSGFALNFTLSSNVASTYNWMAADNSSTTGESLTPQNTPSINDLIISSSATAAQNVTYSVTPTSTLGCVGAVYSVTVTVNPAPVMSSPSTDIICSGGTLSHVLIASVSSSFQWIANNHPNTTGESTTLQSSSMINDNITSSSSSVSYVVVYTVTPTSLLGCTGPNQIVNVTVSPIPVMTSASGATICSGGTENLVLTASASSTFSWIASDNPNTSGESISSQSASTLNNTVTSSNSAAPEIVSYTVTPTSTTSCPGIPQTVNITVNPAPVITSSNAFNTCSGVGLNIPFSSSVTSNYQWIAADNLNTTGESLTTQTTPAITNTLVSSSSVSENISYTVTPTSSLGCAGIPQTINVMVDPAPVMTSPNSGVVCSGVAMNIPLTSNISATYSWLGTDNGNTTGESTTPQSFTTLNDVVASASSVPENISYTVTPTSLLGCAGATQNVNVTVNPSPLVTSTNTALICSGTALNIPLTSNVSSVFSWVAGNNPNTLGEDILAQGSSVITNTITSFSSVTETVSYTVTPQSIAGCTGISQLLTVSVDPAPNMTSANSGSICSGSNVAINLSSDIPSTYTWMAADNASTTGESIAPQSTSLIGDNISSSSASSTVVQYTVTPQSAAGCAGAPQTINITVDPAPVMTNASTANICSGVPLSFAFSSTVVSSYQWIAADNSNTTGESLGSQAGPSITDLVSSSSTAPEIVSYTVTPTSSAASCPGAPQVISITVDPEPVMTSPTSTIICSGSAVNINFNSTISATYNWLAADNTNTTGESTSSQTNPVLTDVISSSSAVAETVTYTVTPVSGLGCNGAAQTVNVTVNAIPPAPTVAGAGICDGATASLTATAPGGTYDWYTVSSGGTAVFTGPTFVTPVLTTTTTYYIESTISGCTGLRTPVTVTVSPNPSFTILAPSTICSGQDLNLGVVSLSGGSSFLYNWSGPGAFGSTLPNPIRTAVIAAHGGTYSLDIANEFSCVTTHTVSISVQISPTAQVTGPTSICLNQSATLSGTGSSANGDVITGYQWIQGSTAIAGATSTTYVTTTAGAYYLEATNSNGCKDTSLVSPLIVNALPTPVVGGPTAFCSGAGFSLNGSASGAGGGATFSTFEWLLAGSTVPGAITINEAFTVGGSYQLVITNSNGCSDTSAAYVVTENFPPAAPAVTFGAISYCQGDSVLASINSPMAGHTYQWSVLPASITLSGPTATSTYVRGETGGSFTVSVTDTDVNSCISASTPTTVQVNTLPTVGVSASATTVCTGTSVTLNGTGANSYVWSGGITDGVAFVPGTTITYTVTGTDLNLCSNTATQLITVNAPPTVTAGASSTSICPGTSTTLNAGGTATSFVWSGGAGSGASVSVSPAVSTTYTVTGSDATSCTATATVAISLLPQPATPVASSSAPSACAGITVLLSSSAAIDNHWFNAASPTVIINTSAAFSQTEPGAGSYSYGLYTQAPGGCSSDTAYVPVTFNSCLSSLSNELLSLVANSNASGNVLNNDGNPAGYTVNSTPLAGPLFGSFSVSGAGAFTYTPNSGYSGVDMIVVQACDVSSNCLNDTIFVVIIPATNNDFGTVSGLIPNSQLTGNVLINDAGTGISGNATLLANVSSGTLTFNGTGNFTYIPNTGYCGLDSFRYQVCDVTSLCNTAYCIIDVNCDITLDTHTGFSPNGDGKNDLWVIGNIDFTENNVSIVDRWGNEIWKGTNYNNNTVVWDGKNKSGEELPSGTYFYLIEVKDKPAVRGWVEITK